MGAVIYNVAKFVAVFLAVSIGMTAVATVLPNYRQQIEYVGIAVIVAAEIWVFTRGRQWQFSVRALLILTTAAAALGAFVMLKE